MATEIKPPMPKMDLKNPTLDTLAITAISIGITIVQTMVLQGVILIVTGLILSVLKYWLRD